MAYVFPGGHLILLHNVVAGSCQSFHSATARLELATRSLQIGEEVVVPNQHAQAGTLGKIPVGPSLHSRCRLVLPVLGHHHGTKATVHEIVSQKHFCEVLPS